MNHSLKERFLNKVNKTDTCWIWLASFNRNGYGQFGMNGTMRSTHRVSYELFNGIIPPSLCVLHTCDNRKCVNPSHLFLGTKKDNTQDMVKKNRRFSPNSVGSSNGHSKLTEQEVLQIRSLSNTDRKKLAQQFNIHLAQVYKIINRKQWTNI